MQTVQKSGDEKTVHQGREKLDVPMEILHNGHNLLHTFPRLSDAIEVLAVIDRIKPVARQMVHQEELWRIHGFCLAHGLCYTQSPFKVVDGTTMIVTPEYPMEGSFFVYLSRDESAAKKAAFYESVRNDEKLGHLLGYPPCCIDFYKEHYQKAAMLGDEYCQFSIANSGAGPYPFVTNNMLRLFDIAIISHFPCSFECTKSVHIGKKIYHALEKRNSALARYVHDALQGPVMYHHGTGIHVLKGYMKKGNIISYAKPWKTAPNQMHDLLETCNNVRVLGKHHIQLRRDEQVVEDVMGEHVGMAFFCQRRPPKSNSELSVKII